ncbi:hypothetical protein EV127DRAFT_414658 [Xylaria flabelliformis]|nr:hypothetical protein EV127DRAFT_414658 [Xylaria flabelliformis]
MGLGQVVTSYTVRDEGDTRDTDVPFVRLLSLTLGPNLMKTSIPGKNTTQTFSTLKANIEIAYEMIGLIGRCNKLPGTVSNMQCSIKRLFRRWSKCASQVQEHPPSDDWKRTPPGRQPKFGIRPNLATTSEQPVANREYMTGPNDEEFQKYVEIPPTPEARVSQGFANVSSLGLSSQSASALSSLYLPRFSTTYGFLDPIIDPQDVNKDNTQSRLSVDSLMEVDGAL